MTTPTDLYDGTPWSNIDLRDLKAALTLGSTIEEAAALLCRSGSIDDVRHKADQLGLWYRSEAPRDA